MTEIRPIRDEEAGPFLSLLCEVFELDYQRASGVFFQEPFFDLRRKWALFEGMELVSVLTTVPLQFGWGTAIGIAGVATRPSRKGEGLAGRLLNHVLQESDVVGEHVAFLFAKETGLYEKCGFQVLDQVIRSPILAEVNESLSEMLSFDQIQSRYAAWSDTHEDRLRRDDIRWKFWKWNLRVCTSHDDGYICHEGQTLREMVVPNQITPWQLPLGTEWVGLRSMAAQLNLPLGEPIVEMQLLGRQIDRPPQMFLTDQF